MNARSDANGASARERLGGGASFDETSIAGQFHTREAAMTVSDPRWTDLLYERMSELLDRADELRAVRARGYSCGVQQGCVRPARCQFGDHACQNTECPLTDLFDADHYETQARDIFDCICSADDFEWAAPSDEAEVPTLE